MNIKVFNWNAEGLKNALKYVSKGELQKYDRMVFMETFAMEPISIRGFYGLHSYAKKMEGSQQEASCYLRPNMGNFKVMYKDENCWLYIQIHLQP